MTITPGTCPTCGESVYGTVDLVPAVAYVHDNGDGTFDYDGESKMYWDGQHTDTTHDGRPLVQCHNGHEWPAAIEE
jgi:hypothetical protein